VPDTGTAHFQVRLPDDSSFHFYLESGPAVDLVTLITIAGTAVAQDDLQTLLDAQKNYIDTQDNPPSFRNRVFQFYGADLLTYLPMDELTGATAYDISGNGHNFAYSNTPTLNGGMSIFGTPAVYMTDSQNCAANIDYFDGDEGSLLLFVKPDAGVWAGSGKTMLKGQIDGNNDISVTTGTDTFAMYFISGGQSVGTIPFWGRSGWMSIFMTWSKINNKVELYANGTLFTEAAYTGTWSGGAFWLVIGFYGGLCCPGLYSDFVLAKKYTPRETVRELIDLSGNCKRVSILGDSTDNGWDAWHGYMARDYTYRQIGVVDHSVPGQSVMGHMAAQAAACEHDDADIIICALGANDGVSTDALITEYAKNLALLKTTNPRAVLYGMGVKPATTNPGRAGTNARIQAACAQEGAIYWNTDGWITPLTDTADGLHPNAAGHQKIAAQALSRLNSYPSQRDIQIIVDAVLARLP
jgi:hypothetical protein